MQVHEGATYHIYAAKKIFEDSNEGQVQEIKPTDAVAAVILFPSAKARYLDDDTDPYMIHETMKVQGAVGDKLVYDKTVSPRGFLGIQKPFYDLRIDIAKKRAAHRVKSVLKP